MDHTHRDRESQPGIERGFHFGIPQAGPPDTGKLSRFFVPLALQAASQALTYPLVAMVASRGPGGTVNLAGLAQANTIMFLLGTLGFGLVTTGMLYARSAEGYAKYWSVTMLIGMAVVALQALLCIPALAHGMFATIMGLPPSIEDPARTALFVSLPLQFLFFLRNPYQVAMYNGQATARASAATFMRITLTAALSVVFCRLWLVGPVWAVVCLTIPVALEVATSKAFAAPFLKELPPTDEFPSTRREIFLFTLPLSIGGLFLSLAALLLGAFIARAPEPERMLPVYYLAMGLANPVAYGATRLQAVVLTFPPRSPDDRRVFRFAVVSGIVMGLLPLLLILPGLSELYYVTLQSLDPRDVSLVRLTALALAAFPFCVAIRAHTEGLAALHKKPVAVLAGQAVFMGTVVTSAFLCLALGVPGYLIGPVGVIAGNLACSGTIRLSLGIEVGAKVPVPPTHLSHGQIR